MNEPGLSGRVSSLNGGLALVVFACLTGCISVTTVNIGQKTSLERQLIGEFEPLTEEEILASSVRAGGGTGSIALDDLKQRAVAARRRQLFNRDDVIELKDWGCLGEDHAAKIVTRDCAAAVQSEVAARIDRLVHEENVDRAAIIDWAVEADPVLTPADRDQVVEVYARLLRERLAPGHWVREKSGVWSQRASEDSE